MNGWSVDYSQLRNPWWRFTRYLRLWLFTMGVSAGIGWLVNEWDGIAFQCLFVTSFQVPLFALWEYSERRKDREYQQGRWP